MGDSERVSERAAKLQVDESDDEHLSKSEVAERAAKRMLEDSEERAEQADASTPDDDTVHHRTSEETAADPEG